MLESQLLQVKYEKEAKVCWFIIARAVTNVYFVLTSRGIPDFPKCS